MSKYFGKCFGPSTPAPKSSFWLRCPSFLSSKFSSQLKLIQSIVRVMESVSQARFSGSCSQDSGSQSRNFQVPRTYFQVFGCQGPRVPEFRVPESRVWGSQDPGSRVLGLWVLGSQVSGLRVPGPGSQVLILDYACIKNSLIRKIRLISKLTTSQPG